MKPRARSSSATSPYFSRYSDRPESTMQIARGTSPSGNSQTPARSRRLSGVIKVWTRKLDVTDYSRGFGGGGGWRITPFAAYPYNQGLLGLSPKSSLQKDTKKQIAGRQKVKIERFI